MKTRPSIWSTLFSAERAFSATRLYIVIPFLIIAVALGVLAWRSYQLSVRMERGLETLAVQYLGYAAEMTARRTDAAIRNEMARAAENWQSLEREVEQPSFSTLRGWIQRHPWIVSGIYVPDSAPEETIYYDETTKMSGTRLVHEFFTSNGAVKYNYDPERLLAAAGVVEQQPVIHAPHLPEAMELRRQSEVKLIRAGRQIGLTQNGSEASVVVPLSTPLNAYAIRSSIRNTYVSSGWGSHRVMSLWMAAVALIVVLAGSNLALRGLRREAETMQLRSALIANISHELRTPLSMIRLGAETLKRSDKLRESDRSDVQESILREVLHLTHLVENVLDVARMQKSGKPLAVHPVDPVELVRSLITTYESWIRSRGFEVDLEIDPAVGEQLWDREAVSRALLNLIDNAMKYSGADKRLVIGLEQHPEKIELSVRDHGIGIREADLQKIFEPYYRAEFSDTETRRGAGLGLTLVQQIVQSHGGKIEVESTPGEGSIFRLMFPKNPSPQARAVRTFARAGGTS